MGRVDMFLFKFDEFEGGVVYFEFLLILSE